MVPSRSAPTRSAPAGSAARFAVDVLERVAERLDTLVDEAEAAGVGADTFGTADEVAERMLATIPQPSPWAKVLGPVYTTRGVRALLGGVTRQAVDDRANRGTLFALTTADRHRVFPAFQFDARNAPLDGLAEVVVPLRAVADEWTVASWLTHPHDELDGRAPIAWLRDGRDRARLLAVVRATAARWSR